jgi:probable HAF family extracellular repeat protein
MALGAPLVWSAQPAPSQYTILEVPGAPSTFVSGINNRGQIVGSYTSSDFVNGYTFVYDKGVYNTLVNPLGVLGSTPFGINDQGQIVGQQLYSDYSQHGFLYDKGVYTIIDHPDAAPPVGTYANGINNRGQIVGSYSGSDSQHGFIYEDGVYTTFDVPGAVNGTFPLGINDHGQITGYYVDSDYVGHGFLLSR